MIVTLAMRTLRIVEQGIPPLIACQFTVQKTQQDVLESTVEILTRTVGKHPADKSFSRHSTDSRVK